jgi:hypothetical protein
MISTATRNKPAAGCWGRTYHWVLLTLVSVVDFGVRGLRFSIVSSECALSLSRRSGRTRHVLR